MPNPPYLCLVLLLLSTAALVVAQPPYFQWECLSVPASVFTTTLQSTIDGVRKVASLVEKFTGVVSSDFRVANAVSDCVDLLDLSSEELSWSLSASQTGKDNGTGNLGSDLKTWLSASLANVDTCIEGFQGTNSFVKSLVSSSLNQLTSLVTQVLHMVHDVPAPSDSSKGGRAGKGGGGYRHGEFPSWISPKDRRLLQASGTPKPDIVVAQDGTSNFTKVVDAVEAAPDYGTKRFVIYVKKGVYDEIVEIKKKKNNIMMVGDGIDATVITGNRSCIDGWTTYRSATFAVKGTGFIARDITFQNTAGPEKHQAVAYRSDSDLSALYRCAFRGYQDTLYTHANRQFFRECTITGTVDFMFGNAAAVFQGCTILARKGLSNQKNTVTAQGRKDPGQNSGFSIQFSNITADPELQASSNSTQTYLGRPWKQYSRTVIMESYIGPAVRPEGWLEWNASQYLDTLYYAEYMNYGPRSGLAGRVKWPGFHVLNSSADAVNFTVAQFIEGNLWLPPTGVRFTAGLSQA